MRQARGSTGARGAARTTPLQLPLRGLFVDAENDEISGRYAAEMENWRSTGTSLETRPQAEALGAPSQAVQRVPFAFDAESQVVVLAADGISAGSASLSRGFTGPALHAAISGQILIAGGGAPLRYDGSAFAETAFTTTTGMSPSDFDGVLAHHDRPYFWRADGPLEFYYGDVGAVTGGALERFPLDRLGNVRGRVASLVSLTVDAGHGMNDTLAIITTAGDVVLYEGLDPGDPSDWRLLGRLASAPPVGPHAFTKVGSDVWMLTRRGLASMKETMRSARLALISDVGAPVAQALQDAVDAGGEFQLHTAADGRWVIVNRVQGGVARQWIRDSEAQAWFTADYPARSWHNAGLETRFTGLDGAEYALRERGAGTEMVTARLRSGWFRPGGDVHVASVTPTLRATGPLTVRLAVLSDHDDTGADLAEAWQEITMSPDEAGADGIIALDDLFAVDAQGEALQVWMEITAPWAKLVALKASVM